MNKIVRERYPVASLPQDLRDGLDPKDRVRVTIESAAAAPLERKRLLELMQLTREAQPLDDDPVGRIRRLRDEWDD